MSQRGNCECRWWRITRYFLPSTPHSPLHCIHSASTFASQYPAADTLDDRLDRLSHTRLRRKTPDGLWTRDSFYTW